MLANLRGSSPAGRTADVDKLIMLGREWLSETGVCEWPFDLNMMQMEFEGEENISTGRFRRNI